MHFKTIYNINLFAISFCLLTWACDYTEEVSENLDEDPYFDVPTLVQRQLIYLDSLSPSVKIEAIIDDQEEVEVIQKDSAAWAETLELFSDANINRPVLQGSYTVKDSVDQQRGWKVRIYRAKQPQKAEIPYLAVYYQDSLDDVRQIEAAFHEENVLYSTKRQMAMQLESTPSGPLLISYQSTGSQKMIFRDSVTYQVMAALRYQ